eukprot:Rmarinus@m.9014
MMMNVFGLLLWVVICTFSFASPSVPQATVCMLIDESFRPNIDSLHAFYDSGEDFVSSGTLFNLTLDNYDISSYSNATAVASHAIENGCLALIVDAQTSVVAEIEREAMESSILMMASSATSIDLSNKRAFPFFSRVVPTDLILSDCVIAFAERYLLDDAVIIYSDDGYGTTLADLLTNKFARENIAVRNTAVVDGSHATLELAVATVSQAASRNVVVASSAYAVLGLFTLAAQQNLTTDGHLWLVSDAYVWYASSLPPTNPERVAITHAVGVVQSRGEVSYAKSLVSYEAYTYDGTMAVLKAINDTVAKDGPSGMLNVYRLYRRLESLRFTGRTNDVFFDENGNRQVGEISFLSFGTNTTNLVGTCTDARYNSVTDIILSNNATLSRPEVVRLRYNFWRTLPSIGISPSRRERALIGRSIEKGGFYLFGGRGKDPVLSDMFFLNVRSLMWEAIVASGTGPPARHSGILAAVREVVIVYGGVDARNAILSDMFVLDVTSYTWQEVFPQISPIPRRDFATCEGVDGFFMFGGYEPRQKTPILNDLWEYTVTNNTWRIHRAHAASPVPPGLARAMLVVSSTWDVLYLYGGTENYEEDAAVAYAFDIRTHEWTVVAPAAPLSPGRSSSAAAYYANSFHIGLGISYSHTTDHSDFYSLDLELCGDERQSCLGWRKDEMRDLSRSGMGLCPVHAGWMYCFGGTLGPDIVNDVNRYRLYSNADSNDTHVIGRAETVVYLGDYNVPAAYTNAVPYTLSNFVLYGGISAASTMQTRLPDYDVPSRDFDNPSVLDPVLRKVHHGTASFGSFLMGFGGRDELGIVRSDLHSYLFLANQHVLYSPSSDDAWPSPREMHAMVLLNNDEFWMFGGATSVDEVYDTWKYSIVTLSWTLLHSPTLSVSRVDPHPNILWFGFPIHNRGGRAVCINQHVFYLGGEYWTGSPTDSIWTFSLVDNTWTLMDATLLSPVSFHVVLSLGSRIIVHGGKSYYHIVDDFYYYEVHFSGVSGNPVLEGPKQFSDVISHSPPRPRAYHWGVALGHSVVLGGGLSGSRSYLDGTILSDVFEYVIGPVCSREEVAAGNTSLCWSCSPGSYHDSVLSVTASRDNSTEAYEILCPPCARGEYSDAAGALECAQCPPGLTSMKPGGTMESVCSPCERGSRPAVGMACSPCAEGRVCPTGVAEPLDEESPAYEFYEQMRYGDPYETQPTPLQDKDQTIADIKLALLFSALFCGISVVVVVIVLSATRSGRATVAHVDGFSHVHYRTADNGVLLNTPNVFGGFFYVEYILFSLLLLCLIVVPMNIMNISEIRTKVPRSMLALGHQADFQVTTTFTAELQFLTSASCHCAPGECSSNETRSYDAGWGPCIPELEVDTEFIIGSVDTACAMDVEMMCIVRVDCKDCVFEPKTSVAFIDIQLRHKLMFADGFIYEVRSTSGYPGQSSVAGNTLYAGSEAADDFSFFLGSDPSVGVIGVTEVLFEDHVDDVEATGTLLSPQDGVMGGKATHLTFYVENELSFSFKFNINLDAVRVTRRVDVTVLSALSDASGVIFAFTALFAILMRCTEFCFVRVGPWLHRSHPGSSPWFGRVTRTVCITKAKIRSVKDLAYGRKLQKYSGLREDAPASPAALLRTQM